MDLENTRQEQQVLQELQQESQCELQAWQADLADADAALQAAVIKERQEKPGLLQQQDELNKDLREYAGDPI
jgi:predicted  nucleic acid-binding Zn-ribbon protein